MSDSDSFTEEHRQRARGESRGEHCRRAREYCADCPEALAVAEPAPVLGPFIGVVGSVLCGVAGALLLLAPFAFDYRQGAGSVPRSSVVDLTTGGCVLLVALLTAALFGAALHKRLRVPEPVIEPVVSYVVEPEPAEEPETAPEPARSESAPEPQPAAPAAATPIADPGNALRDLLTPLVAALAADLRAREAGAETEGERR
jgi:hypothetical protein